MANQFQFSTYNLPDFEDCINGRRIRLALTEFDEWLRSEVKHNNKQRSGHDLVLLDEVRAQLRDILYDYKIMLYE